MKHILPIAFLLFFNASFSQNVIKGKVTGPDGEGIANVNVIIGDTLSAAIITFAMTDVNGAYVIRLNTAQQGLYIRTRAFNFKDEQRSIRNESQTVDFVLSKQVSLLKEVVVQSQIITKSGDTISYNIGAFANQKDRVLADVLKRLPGIKVQSNGTVFYNGEAVNKFYVNGKDLMEGRYGIINNSLPISAVGNVEVLENHQPVSILRDKVPSEKAAINVKLKSNITYTGEGRVGVGYAPFLWNIQLTPMFLAQKKQWLLSYKTNNNGESVESEDNILAFGDRYEGIVKNADPIRFLSVEDAAVPNISPEKYLMNNVHMVSGNLVTSMGKEWEVKANVSFINNKTDRTSASEESFYQSNIGGLKLSKQITNHYYNNSLKGSVTITKNSKKTFFKNVSSYRMFWNDDSALVHRTLSGQRLTATENLSSPTGSFQNSLSAILPLGKKLINVQSFVSYQADRQTLDVYPREYLQFYYPDKSLIDFGDTVLRMSQGYRMESFDLSKSASIKFAREHWTLSADAGIDFSRKDLSSRLTGRGDKDVVTYYGDAFRNELRFDNLCGYMASGLNFRNQRWIVSLHLPLKLYHISARDRVRDLRSHENRFILEPRIYAQREFFSYWKGVFIAGVTTRFSPINELYDGYILTSPATLSVMNSKNLVNRNISKYLNPILEFRNPLSNFFLNFRYNYTIENRNQMPGIYTTGNSNTVANIIKDNNAVSSKFTGGAGKFFTKLKSNISLDISHGVSRSDILFNDSVIHNRNGNETLEFRFNNKRFKWASLDYTFSLSQSRQHSSGSADAARAKYLVQKLDVMFYPLNNHSAGVEWNQFHAKLGVNAYDNLFYDLKYQYNWIKKKIEFEFKWVNISNNKFVEQVILGPVSTTLNRMEIRPGYVMVTVKFNFK